MVTDETLLGGAGALIAALIGLVWTDAKREVESVRKTMVSQSEFQTYIVTTKESIEGHLRADSKLHDEMKLENLQQREDIRRLFDLLREVQTKNSDRHIELLTAINHIGAQNHADIIAAITAVATRKRAGD